MVGDIGGLQFFPRAELFQKPVLAFIYRNMFGNIYGNISAGFQRIRRFGMETGGHPYCSAKLPACIASVNRANDSP